MIENKLLVTVTMTDFSEVNILVVTHSKTAVTEFINSMGNGHLCVIDASYGHISQWEQDQLFDKLFTVFCKKPLFRDVVNLLLTAKH